MGITTGRAAGWRRALAFGGLGLLLLGAVSREGRARVPVVLLSIDRLRPDYLREADRYGLRIPNLRRLAREGATAFGVAGVVPTVTYPSHTTLVTGTAPARHGILANTPFDPLGANQDGCWRSDELGPDVAQRLSRGWSAGAPLFR